MIKYSCFSFIIISFITSNAMENTACINSFKTENFDHKKTITALTKWTAKPIVLFQLNMKARHLTAQKMRRHLFHQAFRNVATKDELPQVLAIYKDLSITKEQNAIEKKQYQIQLEKLARRQSPFPQNGQISNRPLPTIDLAILNETSSNKKKLSLSDHLNIKRKHRQAKTRNSYAQKNNATKK